MQSCPITTFSFNQYCTDCPQDCEVCDIDGCTLCMYDLTAHGRYALVGSTCEVGEIECGDGFKLSDGKCEAEIEERESRLLDFVNSAFSLSGFI